MMDCSVGFGGGAPGVPEQTPLEKLTAERDAALAEVQRLDAEVERCHERLEMTHRYRCVNPETGETARVEIPRAERSFAYDGIDCRDETIKLQDHAVDELRAEVQRLREAVTGLVELFRDDGYLEVCARYTAATGDKEPNDDSGPEEYLAWSVRVDAWLVAKLAAARSLVEPAP